MVLTSQTCFHFPLSNFYEDTVTFLVINRKTALHLKNTDVMFAFAYWFGWWQHGSQESQYSLPGALREDVLLERSLGKPPLRLFHVGQRWAECSRCTFWSWRRHRCTKSRPQSQTCVTNVSADCGRPCSKETAYFGPRQERGGPRWTQRVSGWGWESPVCPGPPASSLRHQSLAGMTPLVEAFSPHLRAYSIQKCIRTRGS